MKLKIIDRNLSHWVSSSIETPKYFEWTWIKSSDLKNTNDLCFVTDDFLSDPYPKEKEIIGWLLEPEGTNPHQYSYMRDNYEKFTKVLTYDKKLLELDSRFVFYPFGGCWINEEDRVIHDKKKLISMIASNKNFGAIGHKLREEIRDRFPNRFDSFGRGINDIGNKIVGLKEYMFSITVENCQQDYYFSEKLIDTILTGTIPIYWGCPSIGDFFDIDGLIVFNTLDELENILDNISPELYFEKINVIHKNFEIAKKYTLSENWIYENTDIICAKNI